ncbi:MAG: hypothetical protein ACW99G_01300 [Candidatus Thorarchaeota archaeon]|jgi:hypothetical protein
MNTRNVRRQTKKLTRPEQRQKNKEHIEYHQQGTGLFVFRNKNDSTLELSKESADGRKHIGPKQEFHGDSYFMNLLGKELTLVRTIEPQANTMGTETKEGIMNEGQITEEKLILDQPATVTTEGTIERVVSEQPPVKKLNETQSEQQDILLCEDPLEGVEILD